MLARISRLAAIALALAAARPAAAEELQTFTIAFAGKGMSFLIQYIAMGAGFYKQEGLEPESVDVSSGTRQAAAVMGGSAEITQVGFAHTMHAVGRGGQLVGIATAFDAYPIALVLSNDAIKRLGITDTMSLDEKIKHVKGVRIGITSPGSSTDEFMRTIMLVRGMDPSRDVQLQPIGIGAPMVAAMQAGSTDGFAFMSPFTNMAVSRGIGQIIADPDHRRSARVSRRAVSGDHHQSCHARLETPAAAACRARADPGDAVRASRMSKDRVAPFARSSRTHRRPSSTRRSTPTSRRCRQRRSSRRRRWTTR